MAVLRLKRHRDEEPIDTLLLACKRKKTEDEHLTSIFKFATTVNDQEENFSKHISKVFSPLNTRSSFKAHHVSNITDKLRAENKLFSQNNRLKVVNCFRALSETDSLEDSEGASCSNRSFTIVEIESLPAEASEVSLVVDKEKVSQNYVYDIYYAPDCELDDKMLDNPISCHPVDDLVFEDYSIDTYDVDEDSDDSNDENNWRNDYPDEDPDSITEDDMKLACQMGDLNISETNSLSSDDPDYVTGIDPNDVDLYGYDYGMYKKRVIKELTDTDSSENSDFFYCDSDLENDKS